MHRQVIPSLLGFLPVTFSASGRHAPYESSHGRTGTVTQGFPRHASRPLPAAACGVLLPPAAAALSSGTPRRRDVLRHNGHGFVSMP